MIKAIVYYNGELIKTYEFSKPSVTIGRLPQNDIPINSMDISRQHLQIGYNYSARAYFAADMGSAKGTFIGSENGEKITETQVSSGEKFFAAGFCIAVEFDGSPVLPDGSEELSDGGEVAVSHAPDGSVTGVLTKDGMFFSKVSPQDALESIADEEITTKAFLIELNNKIIYKINKKMMSFGSSSNDDFYISSGVFASENMATLMVNGDGFSLQSNTMMGKFKLNGNKMNKCVLQNRDRVEFGNNIFTFKIKND